MQRVSPGLWLVLVRRPTGAGKNEERREGGRKEGGREKITKKTKKDEEGEDEEEEDGEIHMAYGPCRLSPVGGDRLMRLAGAMFRCSVQALSALYSLWMCDFFVDEDEDKGRGKAVK